MAVRDNHAYPAAGIEWEAAAIVARARTEAGVGQRELARLSGVSRTTIVEIEQGKRDPSIGTLRAILRALGKELVVDLVDRDPYDLALDAYLRTLTPERRAEMRANRSRFVDSLAANAPRSRPLLAES